MANHCQMDTLSTDGICNCYAKRSSKFSIYILPILMKVVLYKISIRLIVLAIAIVGMNKVYEQLLLDKDLNSYSPILDLVKEVSKDAKVLYIGESSNTTSREDDKDKRAISDFVDDYYPNINISDITKPAGHLGIYHTLLGNLPSSSEVEVLAS